MEPQASPQPFKVSLSAIKDMARQRRETAIPAADASSLAGILGGTDALDFGTATRLLSQYRGVLQGATARSTDYNTGSIMPTAVGRSRAPKSLPLQGRITQGFGAPQAVQTAGEKTHAGVDIAVPIGTPIPDTVGGTVIGVASPAGGYGKNVLVKGDDGITRRYSHLSSFNVKVGDKIKPGTVIGLSGSTGASTGPHLDYREYE